jgi:hypothetical protein
MVYVAAWAAAQEMLITDNNRLLFQRSLKGFQHLLEPPLRADVDVPATSENLRVRKRQRIYVEQEGVVISCEYRIDNYPGIFGFRPARPVLTPCSCAQSHSETHSSSIIMFIVSPLHN